MRKCEKCGGEGPCLWTNNGGRYVCHGCHPQPDDSFFTKKRRCPDDVLRANGAQLIDQDWRQTQHNGLVYEGEDAGCVGYTIWDGDMLEVRIGGDDLGLDEEGLRRVAAALMGMMDRAIKEASDGD